jgi:hypothetical protein
MLKLSRNHHKDLLYIDRDYHSYFIMGVLTEITKHESFIFSSSGHADDMMVVALGHQLLKNEKLTIKDLYELGFSSLVINAIELLTPADDLTYLEYIDIIKHDLTALIVKTANTIFNLNSNIKENNPEGIKFYSNQLSLLTITK